MRITIKELETTTGPLTGFNRIKMLDIKSIALLISFSGTQRMMVLKVDYTIIDVPFPYSMILD